MLEDVSLARPIVIPNELGCMEAIGQGEAGFIHRLGNIDSLAEKTLAARQNESVGELAPKRVLNDDDWHVVAMNLDAIYAA